VLRLGSPGSPDGLRTLGVGVGVTSTGGVGVGVGTKSGVCGKACNPASVFGVGVGAAVAVGVEASAGDAAGRTCPRTGHVNIAPRHPSASKKHFRRTNFLMNILVLKIVCVGYWPPQPDGWR